MIFSKEIKEAGNEIMLIFDGNGTKWLDIISDETSELDFLNKPYATARCFGKFLQGYKDKG